RAGPGGCLGRQAEQGGQAGAQWRQTDAFGSVSHRGGAFRESDIPCRRLSNAEPNTPRRGRRQSSATHYLRPFQEEDGGNYPRPTTFVPIDRVCRRFRRPCSSSRRTPGSSAFAPARHSSASCNPALALSTGNGRCSLHLRFSGSKIVAGRPVGLGSLPACAFDLAWGRIRGVAMGAVRRCFARAVPFGATLALVAVQDLAAI